VCTFATAVSTQGVFEAAASFHTHIFQFISKQLIHCFSLCHPAGRPGKGRRIPVPLLSAGLHAPSITHHPHYKAKAKHPDERRRRKRGAWARTDTSNFPGTSRGKRDQITGHKLKQRKLQLNTRKNFFPLRVTEPWHRLPREAVESPSLEIFKPPLDAVLCSLLWVTLLQQGVGLGDPQRALPTPAMLEFCDTE